ncbi:hypothetical protein DFH07DRAFT_1062837 [Mycena maculata]|uniref:FAD-binding domain-containing protein n=1 Tax=Mycena maculata TaxID=230809 RepID=A0AAD7N6U7_9AGAR|nr:hypothetical protein DFH07DRAFT_1062837 [Mycena maculata]
MTVAPSPPLEFVIVGGSIGGLTAAYTLRRAGHKVLVLEKREAGTVTHGGVRIPPNMTRLLETLPGATELLGKYGTQCSGLTFVDGETSQELGKMKFIDEVMADLGCQFYMLPYDILLEYLLDLCQNSGVEIRYHVQVTSIRLCSQAKPSVVTVSGECIEADVLVGADGHHSLVRDALLLEQEVVEEEECDFDEGGSHSSSFTLPSNLTEIVGSTCSIVVSQLQDDPEMMELVVNSDEAQICLSAATEFVTILHSKRPSVHVVQCGPDLYIISIVRTDGIKDGEMETVWILNPLVVNANGAQILRDQEPRVNRLIALAPTCLRTIQRIPKVEDGFALGRVFSHLTSRDHIAFLLNGYHEVRHKRTTATEASELSGIVASTFPPGPARDARNRQFKTMSLIDGETEMADEVIAATWATYLVQFNYDAIEAVDEWWLNWGKLVR